jgi:hypothetical protein
MRAALALPNATRQIVEEIVALIPQPEPAVLSDASPDRIFLHQHRHGAFYIWV